MERKIEGLVSYIRYVDDVLIIWKEDRAKENYEKIVCETRNENKDKDDIMEDRTHQSIICEDAQ